MINKVTIYLDGEKLEREDIKDYVCISPQVGDIVNRVYYRNKKRKPPQ